MPIIPQDNTPDPEALLRRVWEGRHRMYDLTGLDPSFSNVRVIMSNEAFDRLKAEATKHREKLLGAVELDFTDLDAPAVWTIFGIPVDTDRSLLRNELRFRSEVVL
jgi:hypothetical protein